MKTRVEYRPYCVPFLRPLQTAHGLWRERRGVIVRCVCGRDEAGAATSAVARAATSAVAQSVRYAESAPLPHLPGGKTDLFSASFGTLSSSRFAAPEPKDTLPREVAALLPAGRAALEVMRERLGEGFRTFKWKVGVATDPAEELDLLEELCAELAQAQPVNASSMTSDSETGEHREPAVMNRSVTVPAVAHRGGRLRLDANGGWTQRVAEQWLTRCADPRLAAQIEFIEQPIWAGTKAGGVTETEKRRVDDVLLGLSADYPTLLALDESVSSDEELRRWLERGWCGVFVIKPTLLGEPGTVLAELACAKARVVFSSAMETAVGAKAALRWAFAWEGREGDNGAGEPYALGFGVYPLFRDAAFNGPRAVPFLRWEDVEAIDEEVLWNALC